MMESLIQAAGELLHSALMIVFLIAVLGYLLGRIEVFGLRLGTSGVLLVALVFGHYGLIVTEHLQNFGLVCFVTSVGFIAGPVFFRNFKEKAFAYIFVGLFVVACGAAITAVALVLFRTPLDVTLGLFAGAMTSTPGLAAVSDVAGQGAATGYAIAYPFGVVGVVLFVQLLPRLLRVDIAEESAKIAVPGSTPSSREPKKGTVSTLLTVDSFGLAAFSLAVVTGLILGKISVPLPGGLSFSLGTTGGPLIMALVLGHFGRIGRVSLKIGQNTLEVLRELGLMLFLMGAGTSGGQGFVAVVRQHGIILFFIGILITLIPMLLTYLIARRALHLDMFNCLGSICGGMTSTPALGTLIAVARTGNVAASYAATYPIALLMVVILSQVLHLIFS